MTTAFYQRHVFVCTQVKAAGKKCCSQSPAEPLADYLKERLKALGLHGQGNIRVSKSGCLGRCKVGPNLVIYPEGIWYRYENQADIDEILEKHLQNGEIVTRLLNNPV